MKKITEKTHTQTQNRYHQKQIEISQIANKAREKKQTHLEN
jgi:hypothetical protein